MLITIIINDSAYGLEKPWNALRLASTSVSEDVEMKVDLFCMCLARLY